jgi:protein-S-isoprenylcysteine O-methyltransferase Ste14
MFASAIALIEIIFTVVSQKWPAVEGDPTLAGGYFFPITAHAYISPTFLLGVGICIVALIIRLASYRELGPLYTFKLTIRDNHKLITTGPYSIVRHPAYVGGLLFVLGPLLCEIAPGSWWTEARVFHSVLGKVIALLWACYGCMIVMFVSRAWREDAMLKSLFGKEWEEYARRVRYRYIPGLI